MKTLLYTLSFLCLPLFLGAQQAWVIDLTAGASFPMSGFEDADDAKGGLALSTGATYRFSKIFGLGLRVGYSSNPFDVDLLRNFLSVAVGEEVRTEQEDSYSALQILLAPQIGYFGERFHIALVPQGGYQSMGDISSEFFFPQSGVRANIDESFDGALVYGVGLQAGVPVAEQLEIGLLANYLHANHDSNAFISATDGTETVGSFKRGAASYRSLQVMLKAAYRF